METLNAIVAGASIVSGLALLGFGCLGLYVEGVDRTKQGLGVAFLFVFFGMTLLVAASSSIAVGIAA